MRKKVSITIAILILCLFAAVEFLCYRSVNLPDYNENDDSYQVFREYQKDNFHITFSYKEENGFVEHVKLSYISKTAFTLGNKEIFALYPQDFDLEDFKTHVYSVFFSKSKLDSYYDNESGKETRMGDSITLTEAAQENIGWFNKRNFLGVNVNVVEIILTPNLNHGTEQLDVETFLNRKNEFIIDYKKLLFPK